jgi:hypothetical protein
MYRLISIKGPATFAGFPLSVQIYFREHFYKMICITSAGNAKLNVLAIKTIYWRTVKNINSNFNTYILPLLL